MASSAAPSTVRLSDMPIQQLVSIKQQLDNEIELITQSIQSLNGVKGKFAESGECVKRQSKLAVNAPVLVPLTGSMYVAGTINDNDKFLVDIGTGFYGEMKTDKAVDFFDRKVKFLDEQVTEYVTLVQQKVALRHAIMMEAASKSQANQPVKENSS